MAQLFEQRGLTPTWTRPELDVHGFDWMSNGWPGDHPPPSYAHLGGGDIAMLREAAKADPEGIEEFMINEGFVMAGDPDDCVKVLDGVKASGVDR